MAQTFNTNLDKVAFAYVKQLKARITKISFEKSLKENSYYPSLYSLSSTFDKFNIGNSAFRIEKNKLDEMPLPFIAFMRNQAGGEDFVNVLSVKNETIEYSNDGKTIITTA